MPNLSLLLVSAENRAFALRLAEVAEIMRPLPVDPIPGVPDFVRGVAVVRGAPLPVVDLAMLLGADGPSEATRFVTVKAGGRRVVLAVSEIHGVQHLSAKVFGDLPPLFRDAKGRAMEAIAALDDRLLILLEGTRLVPAEVLETLKPEPRA